MYRVVGKTEFGLFYGPWGRDLENKNDVVASLNTKLGAGTYWIEVDYDRGVNFLQDKLPLCGGLTYSEFVRRAYVEEGRNCSEIAKYFSVTKSAVKSHLEKMGIPRRPRGGRNYWKVTDNMRQEIRTIRRTDKHYAEKFGLHPATVFKIRKDGGK